MRFAGSIDGRCSSDGWLRVRRKSTATRRYVPRWPSHLPPSFPSTAPLCRRAPTPSFSFPTSGNDRCRLLGFFGRGTQPSPTDGDGAPSRGATLHAETSRTLLPNYIPLPRYVPLLHQSPLFYIVWIHLVGACSRHRLPSGQSCTWLTGHNASCLATDNSSSSSSLSWPGTFLSFLSRCNFNYDK